MDKLWIIILLMGLAACTTTRSTTSTTPEVDTERLKMLELVEKVDQATVSYQTFTGEGPVKANINGDQKSFKTEIRMLRDSVIWASAKVALGFEVARVLITPDTIRIMNRLNKQLIIKPFSYIQEQYDIPVTFGYLQALIAGNLTYLNDSLIRSGLEEEHYYLLSASESLRATTLISPADYSVSSIKITQENSSRILNVIFEEFGAVGSQMVPASRIILVEAGEEAGIDINFNRITLDENIRFPFNVSDAYEKIY